MSADGCDRSIRRCTVCGVARITVHPPHARIWPWVEWESANGKRLATRPPCLSTAAEAA